MNLSASSFSSWSLVTVLALALLALGGSAAAQAPDGAPEEASPNEESEDAPDAPEGGEDVSEDGVSGNGDDAPDGDADADSEVTQAEANGTDANGTDQEDAGEPSEGAAAGASGTDGASTDAVSLGTQSAEPGEPEEASEGVSQLRVLLLPILIAPGLDVSLGRHVSAPAIATLESMGYEMVSASAMQEAVQAARTPRYPSAADLWAVMFPADAERAVFLYISAARGQYEVELRAASADGTGPFSGNMTSTAEDLHDNVMQLVRNVMPAPAQYDEQAAAQIRAGSAVSGAEAVQPMPVSNARRPPIRAPDPLGRRFELALTTQAAFGIGEETFYNHLIGVRAGVRLTPMWGLLLDLSYANLNGRDGRAHSFLPMLSLQARIRLSRSLGLSMPVRAGIGYLVKNGAVARFSAGLNLELGERFELGLDLVAPTIWFRPGLATIASMNVGLELIVRL